MNFKITTEFKPIRLKQMAISFSLMKSNAPICLCKCCVWRVYTCVRERKHTTTPRIKNIPENLWLMQQPCFFFVLFRSLCFSVSLHSMCIISHFTRPVIYVFLLFNWRNASSAWCWCVCVCVCELVVQSGAFIVQKASSWIRKQYAQKRLKSLENMCGAVSFICLLAFFDRPTARSLHLAHIGKMEIVCSTIIYVFIVLLIKMKLLPLFVLL